MLKTKQNTLFQIAFLMIIILGTLLRIWRLDQIPNGYYWDELDITYQSYSLLKTGHDYFGNFLPLNIHSFADYHAPIYLYSFIPFVAIFGLTDLAIRLPAAFYGVVTIIIAYFVGKAFFDNKWLGLVTTLVIAIMPWHVQYSRINFEVISTLPFFLIALYGILKIPKNKKWLIPTVISLSMTAYTYGTAKLFIPVFAILTLFVYRSTFLKLSKDQLKKAIIIFVIMWSPILITSLIGTANLRTWELSVFNNPHLSDEINNQRYLSSISYFNKNAVGKPTRLADIVAYNKLSLPIRQITDNYVSAFSTEFLFTKGDPNLRHSPGKDGYGQLYPIAFVLLVLGFAEMILMYKNNNKKILLVFGGLAISILPAAITRDGSMHATRLFFMIPFLSLIITSGVLFLYKRFNKYIRIISISLVLLITFYNFTTYWNYYFGQYHYESAYHFNYGFEEIVNKAVNSDNYDLTVIDAHNESVLIAYLFYTNFDPQRFQEMHPIPQFQLTETTSGIKLDNTLILPPQERNWRDQNVLDTLPNNILLIVDVGQLKADPNKIREGFEKFDYVDTIFYPDNTPAFYLLKN